MRPRVNVAGRKPRLIGSGEIMALLDVNIAPNLSAGRREFVVNSVEPARKMGFNQGQEMKR
jgi:hypothetical protein